MKCPKCRLINPDSALRCDCGYDFSSGQVKESYLNQEATAHLDQKTFGLLTSAFSMEGRLNRSRFLLLIFLVYFGWFLFVLLITIITDQETANVAAGAAFLVVVPLHAFQVVKRLHDLGRPGVHYWLGFIPIYNIYFMLMLLLKKGTVGANKYGREPIS